MIGKSLQGRIFVAVSYHSFCAKILPSLVPRCSAESDQAVNSLDNISCFHGFTIKAGVHFAATTTS